MKLLSPDASPAVVEIVCEYASDPSRLMDIVLAMQRRRPVSRWALLSIPKTAAMHEMSMLESIIETVEEEHRKQPFGRVRMIRLKLGALATVEPNSLRFCFAIIARGSVAEAAQLEIDTVRGAGWCEDCRASVALSERYGRCPLCHGERIHMTAGDELQLTEIEVE